MSSEALTFVLIGFYPVTFTFILGFVTGKQHVQYLAKRGGEERYPTRVRQVVQKYRREYALELREDDA